MINQEMKKNEEDLEQKGFIVLPSCLSPEVASDILENAKILYNTIQSDPNRWLNDKLDRRNVETGGLSFSLLRKQPTGLKVLQAIIHFFLKSDAYSIVNRVFGEDIAILTHHSTFRVQEPENSINFLPFHQDCSFLPGDLPVYNIWTTMNSSGERSPGLELLDKKFDHDLPHNVSHPVFGEIGISNNIVETIRLKNGTVRPIMTPGSSIIFDKYVVHRTFVSEKMDRSRLSLEIRVCPTSRIGAYLQATDFYWIREEDCKKSVILVSKEWHYQYQ